MKRKLFRPEFLALLLGGVAAHGQVVNFSSAQNGQGTQYATINGYNLLYYGQGAYSDPGNNIWNGFGQYPGAGSTYFYGTGLLDNPNLHNNPGNPYAWSNAGSASGSHLFSPLGYGSTWSYGNPGPNGTAGNATSAGLLSPVTLSMVYGFDNGATAGTHQGQASFLLGQASVVNSASPGVGTSSNPLGSFTLNNVAAGTYDLFLYGANYDYNRGAAFTITEGGGTAVGGFTSTLNGLYGGTQHGGFVLGDNYVEFTGVTVGADGTISGTWGTVNNPVGLSGEGDFNGLQLVAVPEPSTLAFLGLGLAGLLAVRRRK